MAFSIREQRYICHSDWHLSCLKLQNKKIIILMWCALLLCEKKKNKFKIKIKAQNKKTIPCDFYAWFWCWSQSSSSDLPFISRHIGIKKANNCCCLKSFFFSFFSECEIWKLITHCVCVCARWMIYVKYFEVDPHVVCTAIWCITNFLYHNFFFLF